MKMTHNIIKAIAVSLLLLVFIGAIQLNQLINSKDEIRSYAIQKWVGGSESRIDIAKDFSELCLSGSNTTHSITLKECAISIHASELEVYLRSYDGIIDRASWPLSIFNSHY